MIVVSDTSVITALIQVGCESLLTDLHDVVLIPNAVEEELLRAHIRLPEFLEVRRLEQEAGFRLSPAVKQRAFQLAGE